MCFLSLFLLVEWRKDLLGRTDSARNIYNQSIMKLPLPGGGSGMTLFSKLIRTKDLRKLQGDDPKSNKPKLQVSLTSEHNLIICSGVTIKINLPHRTKSNQPLMLKSQTAKNELIRRKLKGFSHFPCFYVCPITEMPDNIGSHVARRRLVLWYGHVLGRWNGCAADCRSWRCVQFHHCCRCEHLFRWEWCLNNPSNCD